MDEVAFSRKNEAYSTVCELTCSIFDNIHWCISNNALRRQRSNWTELNKYRESVCSLQIVLATLMSTIVNPFHTDRPHPLASLMIDIVGSLSSEAPSTNVTDLNENGQVVNRVHLEWTIFSINKLLYRTPVTEAPRCFGAQSQHSRRRRRQTPTFGQKKWPLESHHPIPQPDFKCEDIIEDV